jgi:hypothetical protein
MLIRDRRKNIVIATVGLCLLAISPTSRAQDRPWMTTSPSLKGARMLIVESGDGCEPFLAAAIHSKQVPITLTTNNDTAEYFITCSHVASSGSVQIVNRLGDVVWAYQVHKGGFRHAQSMSEAAAKHLKEFIEKSGPSPE